MCKGLMQNEVITGSKAEQKMIEHFARYGFVTNHDATAKSWIGSPTKVISDLRKKGFRITHERVKTERSWYYRYYLEEVA